MVLFGRVLCAESGEPLCGVSVSDGRGFAVTDAHGCYRLERWERAHVLFVNLLTEGDSDWFYYLEDGREEYDFSLSPVQTDSSFCFFHTADTEIDNRDFGDCIAHMRREVELHRPAFFAHGGDLGRISVARHREEMCRKTVGCPVRYAIGNHDFVGERYGEELFERLYGPVWYSFDCGDIHFVTLSIGRGDKPSGYAPEDQWIWLAEDLMRNRGNRRVIVLDHDRCSQDELGYVIPTGEGALRLRDEGLLAWVFGHFHVHMLHNEDGVYSICTACPDCGGIDSSPAAIRKISLCGSTLSSQMLYETWSNEADAAEWTAQLSGRVEFSAPIRIGKDLLVATSEDGYPRRCGVYRLNGETGDTVWFFPTADAVKGDLATDTDAVFVQDTRGVLYCLSAADGSLRWKQKSELIKVAYTRSGVLLAGDTVLAGNAKQPRAYRKSDGALLWAVDFPSGENTPARWVLDEKRGRVLIGTHWKALYSVRLSDGRIMWENTNLPVWFRTSTPCVLGDRIVAAGLDSVAVLDAESGELIEEHRLGIRMDVSAAPVYDGGVLYFSTAKAGVIALDAQTLAEQKRFACGGCALTSSPYVMKNEQTVEGSAVIDGDRLIFAASDGVLYVYHKESGALLQRIAIGAPSLVSPVVVGDAVYTADYSGKVKKFLLKI